MANPAAVDFPGAIANADGNANLIGTDASLRSKRMDPSVSIFTPGDRARPRDLRREMIAETSAFLTWALSGDRGLPRIPRRRVDQGGFSQFVRQPGVRALIDRWWSRTLDMFD